MKTTAVVSRRASKPASVPAKVVAIDAGGHRERVLARRDELIESHLSLVDGIARRVHATLPPAFDLGDLIGVGNVALLHAATRYRPGAHGGTPFSAYARVVVRGAIIESVRRKRYVEATRPGLTVMSPCRFEEGSEREIDSPALVRAATAPTAERDVEAARVTARLAEAISWLPAAQRNVLRAYYDATEPTLQQVAARLRVSTARTRELHAAAVEGIRARFRLRTAA